MRIKTVFALFRGEMRCFLLKHILFRKCKKSGFFMLARNADFIVDSGARVEIGNHSTLDSGSLLACRKGATLSIGDGIYINRNCSIVARNRIVLETGVTIGPSCCIYDHDHDVQNRGEFVAAPVLIKENAWIGAGCIILKGVTIGKGAVVAAGTVVTKDVPDHTVIYDKAHYSYKKLGLSE